MSEGRAPKNSFLKARSTTMAQKVQFECCSPCNRERLGDTAPYLAKCSDRERPEEALSQVFFLRMFRSAPPPIVKRWRGLGDYL